MFRCWYEETEGNLVKVVFLLVSQYSHGTYRGDDVYINIFGITKLCNKVQKPQLTLGPRSPLKRKQFL